LMRANPSPIAALHCIDSEAVGFDQLEKPVLSAGNPFLRAFPVERQARPYGMAEIEYRRASGDGRFGFDVEQENRDRAASACFQNAKRLSHIVLDLIRKHVREDGASDCQIGRRILEGLRHDYGDMSIATLARKHVVRMLDAKAETPIAARDFLRCLRV